MSYRALLLDDEILVLNALKRCFMESIVINGEPVQLDVRTFNEPDKALLALQEQAFDLVISDYRMPGMTGVDFLEAVQQKQSEAARFILSGQTDFSALVEAINDARITRFIAKPWDDDALRAHAGKAIEQAVMQREVQRLADLKRVEQGVVSAHEAEMRRLQRENPALVEVKWGPDGSVLLDDESP